MADYTVADIEAAVDVAIEALRTIQARNSKACLLACGFVVGVEQATRDKISPRPIKQKRAAVVTKREK